MLERPHCLGCLERPLLHHSRDRGLEGHGVGVVARVDWWGEPHHRPAAYPRDDEGRDYRIRLARQPRCTAREAQHAPEERRGRAAHEVEGDRDGCSFAEPLQRWLEGFAGDDRAPWSELVEVDAALSREPFLRILRRDPGSGGPRHGPRLDTETAHERELCVRQPEVWEHRHDAASAGAGRVELVDALDRAPLH